MGAWVHAHVVWCSYAGVVVVWCNRGVVPQGCGATSYTTIGQHVVDLTQAGRKVVLECLHNKVIRLDLAWLRVILSQSKCTQTARHRQ